MATTCDTHSTDFEVVSVQDDRRVIQWSVGPMEYEEEQLRLDGKWVADGKSTATFVDYDDIEHITTEIWERGAHVSTTETRRYFPSADEWRRRHPS